MLQDIKKTLWSTADKLRANVDAAEYKHIALGLIFLKFISDSFSSRQAELRKRLADSNDELYSLLMQALMISMQSWKTATTTNRPTCSGCQKLPAGKPYVPMPSKPISASALTMP